MMESDANEGSQIWSDARKLVSAEHVDNLSLIAEIINILAEKVELDSTSGPALVTGMQLALKYPEWAVAVMEEHIEVRGSVVPDYSKHLHGLCTEIVTGLPVTREYNEPDTEQALDSLRG